MSQFPRVLATKLQPSRVGANLIERARLLQMFQGYESRKLTVVSAPAGYGKTVLLNQFSSLLNRPSVWYQVDSFDNDLAVFVEYLIAGLRKHFQGFGAEAMGIIEKGVKHSSEVRSLVTTIVNDLVSVAQQGAVIIIDDYHHITDESIHQFIEQLLEYLPQGVHFVISSRSHPPLRLTRLKVDGTMVEIGEKDLQFTEEEIAEFFRGSSQGELEEETLKAIYKKTTGWPAAIRLAEITSKTDGIDPNEALRAFQNRREVYNYLAGEVFEGRDSREKDFLLKTSVLDTLYPAICDAITGRNDSREVLESLVKRHLFVSTLEGEEDVYRYHDLFRDFLQSRLGPMRREVMKAAGMWLLKTGMPHRAVEYFLGCREHELALDAIKPAGRDLLRHGRWKTVVRWLQSFPPGYVEVRPWPVLFQAASMIHGGRLQEAERLLDRAEKMFGEEGDQEGLGQVLVQRASIRRYQGRFAESVELIDRGLAKIGSGPRIDLDASLVQTTSIYMQGDLDKSVQLIEKYLTLAEREGDPYVIGQILEKLSDLYYVKGDYSKALEVHQRAAEVSPEWAVFNEVPAIYREWGDLDQALEYAKECLEAKKRLGMVKSYPYSYHHIGSILMDMGDLTGAEENLRKAILLSVEAGGEKFCEVISACFLSRCLALQGRMDEAHDLAFEALGQAKAISPYVSGICKATLGSILIATSKMDEGYRLLQESRDTFEKIQSKQPLAKSLLFLAAADLARGDRETAVAHLRRCLALSAKENYIQSFITFRRYVMPVLGLAIEEGIEFPFVVEVIRRVDADTLGVLSPLCQHKDPDVRGRVIAALKAVDTEEAYLLISKMTRDSNDAVRDAALMAMQAYRQVDGWDNPTFVPRGSSKVRTKVSREPTLFVAHCLGPFRVFANGQEIESGWRTTKARDILAYLLHHGGGPISKERILEDLWPDMDPDQASTLFHTSLYQLRKTLKVLGAAESVLYAGGHYRLVKGMFSTDKDRFDEIYAEIAPNAGDMSHDVTLLEEAAELIQGEYLENLDYDWIMGERERISAAYIEILERLSRHYMSQGDYSRAVRGLRAVLQRNPLLEDMHCALMSAYAAMGDRLAVMQQYETLKEILDKELGVDPSVKTRNLYYKLCGEES